jgi:hypothetical protein
VSTRDVDGILLLYHFTPPYATTVLEHAGAFDRYSRFPVWSVNTEEGFPAALHDLRFRIVVLHYSLFGSSHYMLSAQFLDYLRRSPESLTIAFFQDECYYCRQRFSFIDEYSVDWIYTLLRPKEAAQVYGEHTHGPRLLSTIPGFVGEELLLKAQRYARPDHLRTVDVGYRARSLPYYMGRGAQEKHLIGEQFLALAGGRELRLDIATNERDRLYGDRWYRFLGSCRAVLGVEAGVSIVDLRDEVRLQTEELLAREPGLSFEEVSARILEPWEDNIYYRTISPRHFEAAAFATCQILFVGSYSGILEPNRHYLPLRKDFANLEDVLASLHDHERRTELTSQARRDLIDSGRYSYEAFIRDFDAELELAGIAPATGGRATEVDRALGRGSLRRRFRARLRATYRRWRDARPQRSVVRTRESAP